MAMCCWCAPSVPRCRAWNCKLLPSNVCLRFFISQIFSMCGTGVGAGVGFCCAGIWAPPFRFSLFQAFGSKRAQALGACVAALSAPLRDPCATARKQQPRRSHAPPAFGQAS